MGAQFRNIGDLAGRERTTTLFGIYVHVPFCASKCYYCDFNSYAGQAHRRRDYVDALVTDFRRWAEHSWPEVQSVYFGGGNPLSLEPRWLGRLLGELTERFSVAANAEITIEANPETVDFSALKALRRAGFNRLSLGFQSTDDAQLRRLGRRHTHRQSVEALEAARNASFESVNVDLISGLPGQTLREWARDLGAVGALAPDHVSAYGLTIEPGTGLARQVAGGEVVVPDEAIQARMYERTRAMLRPYGYRQYEISNFARAGHECRHNLLYWKGGNYLGFGAGAHSHWEGARWWRLKQPAAYIKAMAAGAPGVAGRERLSGRRRVGETVMLALRLNGGLDRAEIERRFGVAIDDMYEDIVERLRADGLVVPREPLRLTARGRRLANEVMMEFVDTLS